MEVSPALLNDVVLTRLFNYLGVNDLKNCRLVCKKWMYCTEIKFRKQTRIYFGYDEYEKYLFKDKDVTGCSFQGLNDFFKSSWKNATLKIGSLGFKRPLPWTEPELAEFFDKHGHHVTDLKFMHIIMRDDHQRAIKLYNCGNLLRENTTSLKCLHIDRFGFQDTLFTVPLRPLQENLEELFLNNCNIICEGEKLNLKKLTLCGVKILSSLTEDSVVLQQFVNFDKLKTLKLSSNDNLCVNMSIENNTSMDSVILTDTELIGWQYCNWKIRKLSLEQINISSRNTEMVVNEIRIGKKSVGFGNFQLSFLPPSIQRLSLMSTAKQLVFNMSQQFSHLRYVNVSSLAHLSLLPEFSSCCPNLNELHITVYGNDFQLYTNALPQSIQRLKIEFGGIRLVSDGIRKLKLLVLKSMGLEFLNTVTNAFQCETVILDTSLYNRVQDLDILSGIVMKETKSWNKILVGNFVWKPNEFRLSPLSLYFDKKAPYYSIENSQGLGMTKYEFEKCDNIN